MTTDAENNDQTIDELRGEVHMLRTLMHAIAMELPERAMIHVASAAKQEREQLDREAQRMQIKWKTDYSSGAWEVAVELEAALAEQVDELAGGGRIRTIQPAPIPPEDMLHPDKGY